MSAVASFFETFSGAIKTVFGIGKAVVGGISDFMEATGITALLTMIGTLTTNINGLVGGIAETLSVVIDPINAVVQSVENLTRDIQDKIIAPIVTPITDTIDEIKGLTKSIDRLVDDGISGILKIPGALADSMTSIAGSWDRSSRQLAEANAAIASQILVPGLVAGVAPGLQHITEQMIRFQQPQGLKPADLPQIKLDGSTPIAQAAQDMEKLLERLKNPQNVWEIIPYALYSLFFSLFAFSGTLKAQYQEAEEFGLMQNPTTTLSVGDTLSAFTRGIIGHQDALTELHKHGFNEARRHLLVQLSRFYPPQGQAADWYLRGLIDEGTFNQLLRGQGMDTDTIAAVKASLTPLTNPGVAVGYLARGIITLDQFEDTMKAHGYTPEKIQTFIKGSISPPQVGITIQAKGNAVAANRGWFPGTYGSAPPADVTEAGRAAMIDEAAIHAAWQAHWGAMPIGTAINLFFRGEMNREEVRTVVAQNNYPPEMTELFIISQSELINQRSVPTLLKAGTISEQEARDILAKRGYDDKDISILLDDALKTREATPKGETTELTKLTVAQLRSAYIEGVIDEENYRKLLKASGLPADDIEIIVQLASFEAYNAQKKEMVDTLKAEVELGLRTVQAAVQALYEAGLSENEVTRIAAQFKTVKATSAKLPTYGQFVNMLKRGIINADAFTEALELLGYVEPWLSLLTALETKGGGSEQPEP